jgi:hypothetical protein
MDAPVGDVGLDEEEHLGGGLGDLDEDSVVDPAGVELSDFAARDGQREEEDALEETEELKDLLGLGGNVVDTGYTTSAPLLLARRCQTHPLILMTKYTLGWAGT